MKIQYEFPVLLKKENRIIMVLADQEFENVSQVEKHIHENSWLLAHGDCHIVKVETTIIKSINKMDCLDN